ncbi:MAG: hypothetical protein Fur0010_18990 [Bdellovibrio sp.]
MLDTKEVDEIMELLENHPDQELAVLMLREFNDKTRELGILILNQDPSLSHEEWKAKCDQAKKEVDMIIKRIRSL